mgnify:CR=1 FL=1
MNEEYQALVKLLNDTNDTINREETDISKRLAGKNLIDSLAMKIAREISLLNKDFSSQDFLQAYVSNF